ncbi:putative acetyltransferase [Ceratocystis platani]|uniref:Putative acetyltransferase n=1 Tax=Ceratocystis fimbriata f. sp. platani TaxID=88771 RepID=A0A0F8B4H2_CERFI|nr:putative acetyltransferase [Ceratocystis platani]
MSSFTTLNKLATGVMNKPAFDELRRAPQETPRETPPREVLQTSPRTSSQPQIADRRPETWDSAVEGAKTSTSYPNVVEVNRKPTSYPDGVGVYNKRKRSNSPDGRTKVPSQPNHREQKLQALSSPESNVRMLPALGRDVYSTPRTDYEAGDSQPRTQSSRDSQSTQAMAEEVDALRRVSATGANCTKGGFHCAGYQQQNGPLWSEVEAKNPVALEPKEFTYISPPAAGGYNDAISYSSSISDVKRDQGQHYRGQALRIDPPQNRSILNNDERPTPTVTGASVASPENKLAAIHSFATNAFPTPISANPGPPLSNFSDRLNKDYSRVPPLHDIGRTSAPETAHSGNGASLPQINILNPTRSNSPGMAAPASQVAQMALSHGSFSHGSPQLQHQSHKPQQQLPPQRTEKEEMLAGRSYYYRDRELVEDRERCSTACWRFNNLALPHNGISSQERARLFHEILHPAGSSPNRLGNTSVIEGPFTCDYGYNVAIGQNVLISRDCTLQDAGSISIGDNCHIGPNVKMYTGTVSTDPKRRGGASGTQMAKPIIIESDCFIGGGVVILPGVTVGKGSTVGAGSVVTRNVPPMTVAVGNPARVLRGVST